jgi:MFS family permease
MKRIDRERDLPAGGRVSVGSGRGLEANGPLVLALAFCQTFLVFMPIAVPFFESRGLTMTEVFLVQAWFGLVVLVGEVPSGYLADLFGRRWLLVIGGVFWGAGNMLLPFVDGFAGFLLFETFLGIGACLISGADLALLYDTQVTLDRPRAERDAAVSRHYVARSSSETLAALACGGILLSGSIETVLWVQCAVGLAPAALALFLTEPPAQRMTTGSHADNFRDLARLLFLGCPVLRLTFLALCLWSLTTFFAVWLLQKAWAVDGVPLAGFGLLWAVYSSLSTVSGHYAAALERRLGACALLLAIGILPAVGYALMATGGAVAGGVAGALFFVARGAGMVCLRSAMNGRIDAVHRATVNSLSHFGFRGGFVVLGPLVGASVDGLGLSSTLWLLVAFCVAVTLFVLVPLVAAVRTEVEAAAAGAAAG